MSEDRVANNLPRRRRIRRRIQRREEGPDDYGWEEFDKEQLMAASSLLPHLNGKRQRLGDGVLSSLL